MEAGKRDGTGIAYTVGGLLSFWYGDAATETDRANLVERLVVQFAFPLVAQSRHARHLEEATGFALVVEV